MTRVPLKFHAVSDHLDSMGTGHERGPAAQQADTGHDGLISVVVAVLSVNFFTRVVDWSGDVSIVFFGAGIAMVIAALAYYGASNKGKEKGAGKGG